MQCTSWSKQSIKEACEQTGDSVPILHTFHYLMDYYLNESDLDTYCTLGATTDTLHYPCVSEINEPWNPISEVIGNHGILTRGPPCL